MFVYITVLYKYINYSGMISMIYLAIHMCKVKYIWYSIAAQFILPMKDIILEYANKVVLWYKKLDTCEFDII